MAAKSLKVLFFTLVFVFCFSLIAAASSPPNINAESAVLIDAETGRVLFEKNAYKRLPQASTTKITTALIALEEGSLSDKVTVSKEASETGGAAIWLEEGEVLTLEQLLYGVLLSSANDASAAVAEHISGSEEDFVRLMNRKAREIGARDTHYVNSHGLHNDNQYSTAYDLALISQQAMSNSKFREIVRTDREVIPWEGSKWSRLLINKNKLIQKSDFYPEATGIKSGYTSPAGYCLVGSASKKGVHLIAVVLNSPGATNEVIDLFDYGFERYEKIDLASRGEIVSRIIANGSYELLGAASGDSVAAAVAPKDVERVKRVLAVPRAINPSVAKGDILGQIYFILDGEVIGSSELLASNSVEQNNNLIGIWNKLFVF